jgi:uncharacterized membrane protein HdeD (DUF308 family)
MLELLERNWWAIALRGVIAIAFGLLAFFQPGLTLTLLVTLLAAYLVSDGVSLLASFIRGEPEARRAGWSVAIMGALGIVAGIAAFVWPNISALWLLGLVAFWAILTGAFHVVAAIRLRREINGELLMVVGGGLSIAFGLYLVVNPGDGLLSLVWLVGLWAVVFGISNLALAFRLRNIGHSAGATRDTAGAR